jgi:uncharacterized phage protein (TIGR02218 family)
VSKTIPAALVTHLAGDVHTLAMCWKITRQDGVVEGYTDHDVDIVYDGVTYYANNGFTPTAVQTSSDASVDNLEVAGILNTLSRADIEAGKYDYADVRIFLINHASPSDGIIKLRRGRTGEITLKNGQFQAELRGMLQMLQQPIGSVYSPLCRAELGAAIGSTQWSCGVTLASFTVTGTVTAVASQQQFTDLGRAEDANYFTYGKLTWTSGDNDGLSMEVKAFATGVFTLFQPMPYAIDVGDTYSVYAGCDKKRTTCKQKFNNVVNFRGEPYIPGLNKILKFGGQK